MKTDDQSKGEKLMYNANNGYHGFSMSNRAVQAYESGEKPKSKWTKSDILAGLEALDLSEDKMAVLKKLPKKVICDNLLTKTSWHHTSSYYNSTDFYSIDEKKAEEMTVQELLELTSAKKENKDESEKYEASVEYLTWSGTRAHPKAERHIIPKALVEEKGCFYIITTENGETFKKKKGSNGTYVCKI